MARLCIPRSQMCGPNGPWAVYYMQSVPEQLNFARELHERIRREFPEVHSLLTYRYSYLLLNIAALQLRIYRFWEKPVGPHPTAMFEVNTFNPHQTGTLFSWLAVHRGPCSCASFIRIACVRLADIYRSASSVSVLVHPNTNDEYLDHTELVTWMGRPWPIHTDMLRKDHAKSIRTT